MKKLADKQKEMLWSAAAVLAAIHFMRDIEHSIQQQREACRRAQTNPSPAIPAPLRVLSVPPAPATVVPSPGTDAPISKPTGLSAPSTIWPNRGLCTMRLEVLRAQDKPGYTGYSTMVCGRSLPFTGGRVTSVVERQTVTSQMSPISSVLSGVADNRSIQLQLDQTVGASSDGGQLIAFTLANFGASNLAPNGKKGSFSACAGGQMVIRRVRQ